MSQLARPSGSSGRGSTPTRVLLVRQPMKSIRSRDAADPLPVRLALGVMVALGTLLALWLLGTIGFAYGFARAVDLPGLQHEQGPLLGGLFSGVDMLLYLPGSFLETGLVSPLWLLLGFALICLPAAGLGAAAPLTPGGPRPKSLVIAFSNLGAVLAALFSLAAITWCLFPVRLEMLGAVPRLTRSFADWLSDARFVAGMDGFITIALALWIVLLMRLGIARWLRALVAPFVIVAFLISGFCFSISSGLVAHSLRPLPVVYSLHAGATSGESMAPLLLLGETARGPVVVRRGGDALTRRIEPDLDERALSVVGSQSLRDFARGDQPR